MKHALESRSASALGLILVVVMGFLGFAQAASTLPISIGILVIVIYEFQKRLDQGVPLLQLTALIAVLQWLFGPALNYSTTLEFGRYAMYVPEDQYFRFAIPATAFYVALMLATGASVKQANLLQMVDRKHFITIGILLNLAALGADFMAPRVGGSLAFLMHLISQLRYVGAIYFLFSRHHLRLIFVAASCVQLVSGSVGSGMFHDLILWLAILFCFWFAQRKWSVPMKLFFLTVSFLGLFTIQVVKQEYRQEKRKGHNPSLVNLMVEYMTPGGNAWESDTLSLVVTRLNQGWIISAVMKHVPDHEPFAEGETIKDAVMTSIVPRMLWANKKTAGGRENFRRFTGLQIANTTSMGISPLGEAYANFGETGGILFMVFFGTLFSLTYYGTLRYTLKHPTFLFWIPLIFYQAIKAETELLVIINQLTKGAVVAFSCHFLIQQVFRTKLRMPVSPQPSANFQSGQNR